ncbi:MAG: branched-chain amino acid ABC transporter substrate-binding protein [Zavarzinella sp.]|nr:branched-chain amino acid ABC transporter substrate-binding protein [Zavarzinella sp.]
MPRTGSARGQTDTIANGIKMAIDEYGGEIAGMKVEYLDWDDADASSQSWTSELETANAQRALNDPDVMAYIGPYNSGAAKVSMPLLNEAGVLQVSAAVTHTGLTKKDPDGDPNEPGIYRPSGKITFCRVCPADDVQGPLAADFAKDQLHVKSVYVLDDKELYGQGVAGLFRRRAEALGLKILGHDSINVRQNEFNALMTGIKAKNPDLVYFGGTTQSKGGQIAKDMRNAGLTCPLIVPDGCYEMAFITSAGQENLSNCYVTMGGIDASLLTGPGAEFVRRYKEKYGGNEPEAYAVYGYEAAKVVLESIKAVGRKDRAAVVKQCVETKDFDKGALGKWSFDANGDITLQNMTISKVEGGKFKPVKTIDKQATT